MALLAFFISRSEGQIQEEGKQKLRISSVLNPPFLQLKGIASENKTNDDYEGFTKDLLDTLGYDYEIVIPGVNFINILRAAFAKKSQSQTVIREKLCKALLYKKGALKMLMKLSYQRTGCTDFWIRPEIGQA